MARFPRLEEFAKAVAEEALDEYEYNGKTLRQWIDAIIEFEKENKKDG